MNPSLSRICASNGIHLGTLDVPQRSNGCLQPGGPVAGQCNFGIWVEPDVCCFLFYCSGQSNCDFGLCQRILGTQRNESGFQPLRLSSIGQLDDRSLLLTAV